MNTKPYSGKRLWFVRGWLIALVALGVIGAFFFGLTFLIWVLVPTFLLALLPPERLAFYGSALLLLAGPISLILICLGLRAQEKQ